MIYNYDDLSFKVLTVDRFYHKQGLFNVSASSRSHAALSFRVNGSGIFEIGSKRFVSNPGDVLFIPANTPYKVEYSVSESIVIHFLQCNYFEAESFSFENPSRIGAEFQYLMDEWQGRHSSNKAKSIIYDILEKMDTDRTISNSNSDFSRCIRYMENNLSDPKLDIETLCDVAFTSVSGLQRSFAKHFGISPKQYLIRLRMEQALKLLAKNELSVKEIAFASGFEDEKYFTRAFKKKYGYSPSHFRNNMIL